MYVPVCMCVEPTAGAIPQVPSTLFSDISSQCSWGITRLRWLTFESLGSSPLYLPNAEITDICLLTWMESYRFFLLTHKSAGATVMSEQRG